MRVVFVLTQDRGGPADLSIALARELSTTPAGPQVLVVGPPTLADAGLPRHLLRPADVRSKLDVRGYAAVRGWLDRLGPDVVHAQDRRAGLVCAVVTDPQIPVVLTLHGIADSAAGRWVRAGPWHGRPMGVRGGSRLVADALVSRRVRCTLTPSQAMAAFAHQELRIPWSRLRVVHNGVRIPAVGKSVGTVRTFITAGSFAPCKATPQLVEAFLGLAARGGDLRLKMLGDGGDRHRCESLARRSAAGVQVEFTGYRTDVAAQLQQADAFVLSSVNENLPLALLQAMALGLACIAPDVGGIAEVLDGDCGILVQPGDVRGLRAAMRRLVAEPGLARRLGSAARQRVTQQFSLARCADGYQRLWSDVRRPVQPRAR